MTCDDLSHRLPDVAASRTRLTAEEQRHLDACPECSGELKLLALTARLGGGLGPVRQPEETARKVLARLAANSPRRSRAVLVAAGLAAAAAIIFAIRSVPPSRPMEVAPAVTPPVAATPRTANEPVSRDPTVIERESSAPRSDRSYGPVPAPALLALPELDGMAEGELEIVLDQLDRLLDDPLRDEDEYRTGDAELARMLTAGDA